MRKTKKSSPARPKKEFWEKLNEITSPQAPLTKEEIRNLLEEGRKAMETFQNPPPPGDYEIGFNRRAKLLEQTCVACKSKIEAVYSVHYPNDICGPGGKGHWRLLKHRCSQCRLVYDID